MREDQVANGVQFLQHPNVQSTPISERIQFLEQKGLTKEEVQEALERYQNASSSTSPSSATVQYSSPPATTPATAVGMGAIPAGFQLVPKRYTPPYIQFLTTVASIVGAATVVNMVWNYARENGWIPWLSPRYGLEDEKVKEEEEKMKAEDEQLMTAITGVSTAIQEQTQELSALSKSLHSSEQQLTTQTLLDTKLSEQSNAKEIATLQAQVSALQKVLEESSVPAPSPQKTAVEKQDTKVEKVEDEAVDVKEKVEAPKVVGVEQKMDKMEDALKRFRTENSLEDVKQAASILSMYVRNLTEHPDVPRYRRIATGNVNYKQKIQPLHHHEEVLRSIGFENRNGNLEWTWHSKEDLDAHLSILQALLKSLQSLSSNDDTPMEQVARNHFQSLRTPALPTKTEEESVLKPEESPLEEKAKADETDSLTKFMERLNQQSTSVEPKEKEELEEKDEPKYPQSFSELMKKIENGEKVPGIKDIEDRLSDDSSDLLQKSREERPQKPWESIKT